MATFSKGPSLQLDEGEREELIVALDDVLAWSETLPNDPQLRDALYTLKGLHDVMKAGMLPSQLKSIRRDRSDYFRRKAESVRP